jgi:hypothetical protein
MQRIDWCVNMNDNYGHSFSLRHHPSGMYVIYMPTGRTVLTLDVSLQSIIGLVVRKDSRHQIVIGDDYDRT